VPFPSFSRVGGAWSHGRSRRELSCVKAVLDITEKQIALFLARNFKNARKESREETNSWNQRKAPEASKCASTYARRSLNPANGRPPVRERSVLTDELQKQIQMQ
jgi:hypothetical protein